jgi:hypothetical protein
MPELLMSYEYLSLKDFGAADHLGGTAGTVGKHYSGMLGAENARMLGSLYGYEGVGVKFTLPRR